jgi:hypothetical protein
MSSSRLVILLAALLLADAGACGGSKEEAAAASAAASQALLKRYVDTLRVAVGAGAPAPIAEVLRELTSEAAALRVGDEIGDDFFARYSRLLLITHAIVEPRDPSTTAVAERSLAALADSLGHTDPVSLNDGLAGVVPLLREEVIRLHLLTDPNADRNAVDSRYFTPAES